VPRIHAALEPILWRCEAVITTVSSACSSARPSRFPLGWDHGSASPLPRFDTRDLPVRSKTQGPPESSPSRNESDPSSKPRASTIAYRRGRPRRFVCRASGRPTVEEADVTSRELCDIGLNA
jgi:hypothetical protein